MNTQTYTVLKGVSRLLAIGWLFDAIGALTYLPNQLWLSFRQGRPADVTSVAALTTLFHTFLDVVFAAIFWFCASRLAKLAAGDDTSTALQSVDSPKV
jgi:hypothetical protein